MHIHNVYIYIYIYMSYWERERHVETTEARRQEWETRGTKMYIHQRGVQSEGGAVDGG